MDNRTEVREFLASRRAASRLSRRAAHVRLSRALQLDEAERGHLDALNLLARWAATLDQEQQEPAPASEDA